MTAWEVRGVTRRAEYRIDCTGPHIRNPVVHSWPSVIAPDAVIVLDTVHEDGKAERRVTVLGYLVSRGKVDPIDYSGVVFAPEHLRRIPPELQEVIARVVGVVPEVTPQE